MSKAKSRAADENAGVEGAVRLADEDDQGRHVEEKKNNIRKRITEKYSNLIEKNLNN